MNHPKTNVSIEQILAFSEEESDRFLVMFTDADYDEFKETIREGVLEKEDLEMVLIFAKAGMLASQAALTDSMIPLTEHQMEIFSFLYCASVPAVEYASELMKINRPLKPLTLAKGRKRMALSLIDFFFDAAKTVAVDQSLSSDLKLKLGAALEYSITNIEELKHSLEESLTEN